MIKTLAITSVLIVFFISCKKDEVKVNDPKYAIGVIQSYNSYTSPQSIYFSFTENNQIYYIDYFNGHNGWNVPSSGNYNAGDKYMVQYDSIDPNTARMLFSYKVTDSVQYNADVTLFKTNPPN